MPTTISVTFPLGYVHATPWMRHVNEGIVEWPPSPWRLLRALVATWKTRCPHLAEADVVDALRTIEAPPDVWTQVRTESSVRTYLPPDAHRSGLPKTDLMVDAFAAVDRWRPALAYRWQADVDGGVRSALAELVGALGYLGRAESVCCASLDPPPTGLGRWLVPLADAEGVGQRTMVATTPLDLDALCVAIGPMRRGGRLHPLGASWVRYDVPAAGEGFEPPAQRRRVERPSAIRLALSAPALPSVYATVLMADELRRQAMLHHPRRTSPTFSGKHDDGRPRREREHANQHAHWLMLDLDDDGLLDTAVVWAPEGFGPDEVRTLATMRAIEAPPYREGIKDFRPVRLAVEAVGSLDGTGLGRRLTGPARVWRTVTPFAPQRHRKRKSFDEFIDECVRREIAARPHLRDAALALESVELGRAGAGAFRRHRRKETVGDQRSAFHLTLTFRDPVWGPISIGALSHFGLGLFAPADEPGGTW